MTMEKSCVMMKDRSDKEYEEYRRKPVPQVRGGIPERAVCDVETGVTWWLTKSDQCGRSRRLHCDEITQSITWRRRLEVVEITLYLMRFPNSL